MGLRRSASAAAWRVAAKVRAVLGGPASYLFLPAPSIEDKRIRFRFAGTTVRVEAGYSTPPYETIAEVVDSGCYQLDWLDRTGLATGSVVVKVDCEGGEYDLVDQLTPDTARRVHALTIEVHERSPERSVRRLSRQLEALGYILSCRPDPFDRPQLTHVLARR